VKIAMPETLDSAGSPEFKELPAMHIPQATGKDSQKPPDPSSLTGPTAKGGDKAPAPMGASGAPPSAGGAGGGLGGKPPVPQPVQKTPEQKLNEDSLDALRQEIHNIVKRDDANDIDSVLDGLLNDGWRPQRLDTLIDETESKDVGKLFENVLNKEYKKEEEVGTEGAATQLPPAGKEVTPPTQDTTKKPDNDQTGVNLKQTKAVTQNYKRGGLMSKKVILSDGTLLIKEAKNVSEIISGISLARRKVEAALNKYVNTKIALAGMDALGMGGGMPPMGGGMGGMESADSLLGIEEESPKKTGLMSIIDNLKDVVEELMEFLGKGEETKLDESISAPDAMSLDTEIGAGKGILDKVKKEGPAADKKKESPEKDKGAPPFGKKEDKEDEGGEKKPPFGKKEEDKAASADGVVVTAVAGGTAAEGGDPMKATVGGKPKKKKAEEEGECEEEEDDDSKPEEKKGSSVIDKIMQRVAEMKQANLYPFKDLNKQQVDNINAETASSQASTINKEISGGKHAEKESIAPKGISTENPTVSTGSPNNSKPVKGTSPKKAEVVEDGSAKISIEAAEKIKQHSIENAVSKAKLAVELASRQQLKGLIENPLKTAFVKNMVEAGIDNEVAEAISHNAFLDGYQAAQQLIIKEAFETFMEKDLKDFVKVAEFTESYKTKEGSQAPAEEGDNNSQVKTASVVETEAPLRGTQVSKDRKEEFKTYWSTVANERFGR
jgi:hypothetical protein